MKFSEQCPLPARIDVRVPRMKVNYSVNPINIVKASNKTMDSLQIFLRFLVAILFGTHLFFIGFHESPRKLCELYVDLITQVMFNFLEGMSDPLHVLKLENLFLCIL